MRAKNFKLVVGYGDKDWIDNVTKNKICYWGKNIYALSNLTVSGLHGNEELISDNHVNFKRDYIRGTLVETMLIEGILIVDTSTDMLTAGSMLDRFIREVLPIIKANPILPPY